MSLISGGMAMCLCTVLAHAQPLNVTLTSKTYTPSSIAVGGTSTLTFQITNATAAQISNVTVSDAFPAGVSVVTFLQSSQCGLGSLFVVSNPLSATVSVDANSVCTFSYVVRGDADGTYLNSTANITGWNGNALAFAPATLVVGSGMTVTVTKPIPTLSDFALVLLVAAFAVVGYRLRSRS